MELQQVRVQNYKCIEDSDWVDFEQVTCFVGKNESGKTAFLQALNKLNPVNSSGDYDPLMEYPRRRFKRYEGTRHEHNPDPVASARYELSDSEVAAVEAEHGENILNSKTITVTKDYKNQLHWEIDLNEKQLCENLLEDRDLHWKNTEFLEDAESLEELANKIAESEASGEEFETLEEQVEQLRGQKLENEIGSEILESRLPEFFYFDEYSLMNGKVDISQLIKRQRNDDLTDADETFLALLAIAGLSLEDIRDAGNFERIIAELEASSNLISDQVFDYWSQGPDLQVEFKRSEEDEELAEELDEGEEEGPVLHVRVRNNRHRVSVSFDERSSGFIWFFSFLAYFSDLEGGDNDLVLLLDEPGLNLHAKAQHDFLQFINERLSPNYPVAYTTHSPFMLEPGKLHRARLVIDDPEEGTRISEDVLGTDQDTVFPLQAVLGYDLIRTLLIGPECLLVEGKSDMTYLQLMSSILEEEDRTPLSHRWTVVPVNGADNVSTFVSLFGASELEIAILLDDDSKIDQRLQEIESRGVIDLDNVKTVADFIEDAEGDTEDLFSNEFYLELVNAAYRFELRQKREVPNELSLDDIQNQHPRITKRLELYFKDKEINDGKLEHHRPAAYFQKNRDMFEDSLDEETKDRFETLFQDLNEILQ